MQTSRALTEAPSTINVLVVDDHPIVRKGICALLDTEQDINVVGEARNGQEAIAKTQELKPDVILMDLVMPVMTGLEAIVYITTHQPDSRILVLTSSADTDKIFPAIKAGALGYLLKDSGPDELLRAIHQVYQGNSSLQPAVARKLLREIGGPPLDQSSRENVLTDREKDVLLLVAKGQSNQDIASRLAISEATVRTHVSHILTS